ncbi:MAG: hypothetical protein KGL39_35560 [Patescibacteria group bacterium]|nr:hypothetical protein [Patescibacteria group bacterium]
MNTQELRLALLDTKPSEKQCTDCKCQSKSETNKHLHGSSRSTSIWIGGIGSLSIWDFPESFPAARYNAGMPRDHQHNPDPNVNAARIVSESTAGAEGLPDDVEAAWDAWSAHIQNVDEHKFISLCIFMHVAKRLLIPGRRESCESWAPAL